MNQPAEMSSGGVDAAWSSVVSTLHAARERTQKNDTTSADLDVTLLTGFLGSGKTTVLRHLLENPGGMRIAVVVNDVGAVEVDAHLVKDASLQQVSLSNGCVCCVLGDDLANQLEHLATVGIYDAVVIEASGIADPIAIAQIVQGANNCRLDGIVAVADSTSINTQLADQRISALVTRQLQAAHLVVLSKGDLVEEPERQHALQLIADVAPGGRIIQANNGAVDLGLVVGAAVNGVSMASHEGTGGLTVVSLVLEPAGPWHPIEVGKFLDHSTHGLLRAKGWFEDLGGNLFQLQVVGRRWEINRWSGEAPKALVLIGLNRDDVTTTKSHLRHISQS
ncbi:MAG: CobW family GTP-binding protein [Actinomycetota bacterium]|nr:CobW family GTP-binding protein [Actinomycetota bacterium]